MKYMRQVQHFPAFRRKRSIRMSFFLVSIFYRSAFFFAPAVRLTVGRDSQFICALHFPGFSEAGEVVAWLLGLRGGAPLAQRSAPISNRKRETRRNSAFIFLECVKRGPYVIYFYIDFL